ncbi:MAG: trigger factor [Clostridium sp.]|jgi:trigger factor
MRKWKVAGLCVVTAAVLLASGCSGKTEEGKTESTQAESQQTGENGETEAYVAEDSVKLGQYKGIKVTVTEPSVTDEEVEAQIQQMLNSKAEYKEVDREAKLNDQVNIDYKGLLDGEAFEGGTAEGANLVLGSGDFIDGFEDGLVGAKKGDKKSLNLTFPDPYSNNPDLAGKAVVFEVTVNAVKERVIPELTDELIAEVSPDDGTVEKYRASMRETLLEQKQLMIDNQRDTDILNALVDGSEIVCSTERVDKAYETQLETYTNMASMYGLDLAAYAGLMGMDEDGFKAEVRKSAKLMAQQELALKEVARLENIAVEDEDRKILAEEYGFDSVEELLEQDNITEEMVDDTALIVKTMDYLVDQADITVSEEESSASEETVQGENE